jgi:branched-subunit amino acid aminotransferase/4-amino-4-deoxychorismate lyase
VFLAELNGEPPAAEDLLLPAVVNYGHFTSMQVREGRVRGLDLHLRRLADANPRLFGTALDTGTVRAYLRHAVATAGVPAASVRVTVFARDFDRTRPAVPVAPDVLVTVGTASEPGTHPLRVRTVRYQRPLPEIKHAGTFAPLHHTREARLAGFDDVLFLDRTGHVSEGSVWNVGFLEGDTLVWPEAPVLPGTSMRLLQGAVERRGIATVTRKVRPDELAGFRLTFTANSGAVGRPIGAVDGTELPADPELAAVLAEAYATITWDEI